MQSSELQKGERIVSVKRQPGGGLGISVKGGAEHGIPVLISRVFPGQVAEKTHLLHPGDAIVAINGKRVEHWRHDDVVNELRSCGQNVSLTVRVFDGASRILSSSSKNATSSPTQVNPKVDSNEPKFKYPASSDANSPRSSPVKMEIDLPVVDTSTQLESSVLQETSKELSIPLLFARLEGYETGTDNERKDAFEVFANDQSSSGLITCSSVTEREEWFSAISETINGANEKHMPQYCHQLLCEEILQMNWIHERKTSDPTWKHSFLVLTANELRFFSSPPTNSEEWQGCKRVHSLFESLRRVHSGSRPLLDNRQHCFSMQHGTEPPIYCSVSTKADLTRWTDRMEKATYAAVNKMKVKTYSCTFEGQQCEFTVHLHDGFQLVDATSQELIWSYKFSQLRNSSDDGKSLITFTFHNRATYQVDRQSFSCNRAYHLLFCVHSFLAAKLAQVDPALLEKVNAHTQISQSSAAVNGVPDSESDSK